jgi:DNA-directed RNA polymerase specialized sigma24 family protein
MDDEVRDDEVRDDQVRDDEVRDRELLMQLAMDNREPLTRSAVASLRRAGIDTRDGRPQSVFDECLRRVLAGRVACTEPSARLGVLFGTIANIVREERRKDARFPKGKDDLNPVDPGPDAPAIVAGNESVRALLECIKQCLTSTQKDYIRKRLQGMGDAEIARNTGIDQSSVHRLRERAFEKLRMCQKHPKS